MENPKKHVKYDVMLSLPVSHCEFDSYARKVSVESTTVEVSESSNPSSGEEAGNRFLGLILPPTMSSSKI